MFGGCGSSSSSSVQVRSQPGRKEKKDNSRRYKGSSNNPSSSSAMFRRKHQEGGDEAKQSQQSQHGDDGTMVMPTAVATHLWEADVATLEKVGELFTDVAPHWRFVNHSSGETIALRLFQQGEDALYLKELGGPRQVRVDDAWLAISEDPDEKWNMARMGLRLRWGANIWEGSFNEDKTVWSSTTGYLRHCSDKYVWREVLGTGKTFTFVETRRDGPGIVHLHDPSRHLHVRLTPTVMQFNTAIGQVGQESEWQVIKRGHWTDDGESALTQQRLGQMCLSTWSVDDVCDFFTALGLKTCVPKVRQLSLDGLTLQRIDDSDLKDELGVTSGILRKKVLANISRAVHTTQYEQLAPRPATASNAGTGPSAVYTATVRTTTPAAHPPSTKAAAPAPPQPASSDDNNDETSAGIGSHASRVAASQAARSDGDSGRDGATKKEGTVFLSYTWKYQERVRAVRDKLADEGYATWMDIQQLSGGDNLLAQIDHGIRTSDVVVSFVSSEYSKSDYCRKEVMLAENLQKPILCVLVEPAPRIPWPPTGPMGPVFAGALYIEYFNEETIAAVVRGVTDRIKQARALKDAAKD
ncbi:hypothetical protein PTSG_05259 [Salpingoeca rosetta]|uniref:SAM domain-containing protein n=1 Tax=Salpingoeca rosetta (strain ATCC 50818 / BSB-021) TaxID=946362 RepID=F2U9X7_SALR5|nr:uncharacterized protein PTSG_05259 [Salpingoeca rosetta]EGD73552.1 hypothetical protein PTSG_05259 [Salpingoeca rosetta]|eukprot:XP_004993834.1 hypothetical protein PTSG_05259 [Salpingoeca rosetta]